MKRNRLLIVAIAIVILALGSTLYVKRHTFFPTPQMKGLRRLEAQLDLPEPKHKTEEDLGLNNDWEGASHYERHIALSYEDVSVLNMLRAKLLNDSWQEKPANTIGTYNYFSFQKGSGNAMQCVSGYTKSKASDGITLYIYLEAAGEYTCNPASGT